MEFSIERRSISLSLSLSLSFSLSQIEMKEEDRLAAVVARIDEEVGVVPRGAYIKTPLGEVVLNKSFQGMMFTVNCFTF